MVDPLADAALLARRAEGAMERRTARCAVPVRVGGERIGGVRVGLVVGGPSATQAKIFAPITAHWSWRAGGSSAGVAMMLVFVLLFGASVIYLMDWRILEPIRNLGRVMAEDRPGPASPLPADTERSDEIGDLMRAFHPDARRHGQARPRHPPHGLHRSADRAGQPPVLPRTAGRPLADAACQQRRTGLAVRRPGRLQARQRHARPRSRRRGAEPAVGPAATDPGTLRRERGGPRALRRRRVHRAVHGRRNPRGVGAPGRRHCSRKSSGPCCLAASRCSSARRSASPCSRSTPTMRASC